MFLRGKKNHKWGTFISVLVCFTLLLSIVPAPAAYAADGQPELQLEVEAAILIEAETGQILYEYNKDKLRPPASMAKMMSEYVILDAIKSGRIGWEDIVPVSKTAAATRGSGALLAEGETYTVRKLFENMSIFSGNDASVALAEYIAGSEEQFAKMLNDKAKDLGLSEGAYFINATGLDRADMAVEPASLPGETQMTAYDAALLARRIIQDHPDMLEFSKTTTTYLKPDDDRYLMTNWNWMLEGWKGTGNDFDRLFSYEGLDGLKTGSTTRAGYCFTGTAERNGMRLISVVMGAKTMHNRFHETRKLMDYGFNTFEKTIALMPKTELEQLSLVEISKGKEKEVSVVTDAGAEFIVRKGTKPEDFVIEAAPLDEESRVAPIQKGQILGQATVTYTSPTGEVLTKEVNLVAADDVEKANWFVLMLRGIGNFFKNMFEGIKNLF